MPSILRFAVAFVIIATWGQVLAAPNVTELSQYKGKDREQRLLEEAKKEGKVVWYTSLGGMNYKTLAKVFEQKYGIEVETFRGSSKRLVPRIFGEAESGHHNFDLIETSRPTLMVINGQKVFAPYMSPQLDRYPDVAKQKAGKDLVYWATDRETYIGLTYNKNSIAPGSVPRNYEGLLNPALKGSIGFATTATGARVIGALLHVKGKEFIDKLKAQEISLHAVSGRALLDLVVAGEVGLSPTTYKNEAMTAIAKGAPVEWLPMDVVPTNAGGVAISANAPHPHAALLMADFILGPEGQKIYQEQLTGSAWLKPGFERWYPEGEMSREAYIKTENQWKKVLRTLGQK